MRHFSHRTGKISQLDQSALNIGSAQTKMCQKPDGRSTKQLTCITRQLLFTAMENIHSHTTQTAQQEQPKAPKKPCRSELGILDAQACAWLCPCKPQELAHPHAAILR